MDCNKSIGNFQIYQNENKDIYYHYNLRDDESFYSNMFDLFMDSNILVRVISGDKGIVFKDNCIDSSRIYRYINKFIDEEILEEYDKSLDESVELVLKDEGIFHKKKLNSYSIRKDKAGKLGEHIMNVIFSEYNESSIVINKLNLITDNNMSVFGIDTLFYNSTKNMLMFGESKFTKSISNGITLINSSLENYENQILDEYSLVIGNETLNRNLPEDIIQLAGSVISFRKFIELSKMDSIGIPILITHGDETDIDKIFEKLSKINQKHFLGLDINYFFVSLPIINKDKLINHFTELLLKKIGEYDE